MSLVNHTFNAVTRAMRSPITGLYCPCEGFSAGDDMMIMFDTGERIQVNKCPDRVRVVCKLLPGTIRRAQINVDTARMTLPVGVLELDLADHLPNFVITGGYQIFFFLHTEEQVDTVMGQIGQAIRDNAEDLKANLCIARTILAERRAA